MTLTRALVFVLTACLSALLFGQPRPAHAHDLGLARVIMDWKGPSAFTLSVKLAASVMAITPHWPEGCTAATRDERRPSERIQFTSWHVDCAQPPPAEAQIRLPFAVDGALVVREDNGGTAGTWIPAQREGVILPMSALGDGDSGWAERLWSYIVLGTGHILEGADHLSLVLVMCLVARGWALVAMVSAFTLGHSLTLLLGVTGVIALPPAPTEVLIALSIAFLARAAFRPEAAHGAPIAVLFGLLHGLGFAGAMGELGVAVEDLPLALLGFNLGVEAGQLLFVLVVLACGALMARSGIALAKVRPFLAIAVGGVAMGWTLERAVDLLWV